MFAYSIGWPKPACADTRKTHFPGRDTMNRQSLALVCCMLATQAFPAENLEPPSVRGLKVTGTYTRETPDQQEIGPRVRGPVRFENYYLDNAIVLRFWASGTEEVLLFREDLPTRYSTKTGPGFAGFVNYGTNLGTILSADAQGAAPFYHLWRLTSRKEKPAISGTAKQFAAEFTEPNQATAGKTARQFRHVFSEGMWASMSATSIGSDGAMSPALVSDFRGFTNRAHPLLPTKLTFTALLPTNLPPESFHATVTDISSVDASQDPEELFARLAKDLTEVAVGDDAIVDPAHLEKPSTPPPGAK